MRRTLPMEALRSLDPPGALERCLCPGGSIEEGGVVVGLQRDGARPSSDVIWLAGLLTEKDGLVLLAEADVLRRSADVLAFWSNAAPAEHAP